MDEVTSCRTTWREDAGQGTSQGLGFRVKGGMRGNLSSEEPNC